MKRYENLTETQAQEFIYLDILFDTYMYEGLVTNRFHDFENSDQLQMYLGLRCNVGHTHNKARRNGN